MKKIFTVSLLAILVVGCGKKENNNILGTWETKYEMSIFGEVTETYTFKKNNECVRILNAGSDIIEECTYEIKDKEIRIVWENKIDKESYSKYIEIDENTIVIAENTYTRKK